MGRMVTPYRYDTKSIAMLIINNNQYLKEEKTTILKDKSNGAEKSFCKKCEDLGVGRSINWVRGSSNWRISCSPAPPPVHTIAKLLLTKIYSF